MYISLQDLAVFIIFIFTVIIGGYLIAILRQVFSIVSNIREILHTHDEDIHKTMSVFPEVLVNIKSLTESLKETADQTNSTFGSLQNNLLDTVDDLRGGLESLGFYAKLICEVFRTIFSKAA